MATDTEQVYRVLEPFSFDDAAGRVYVMRKGDIVEADNPAFKGREHLFEPVSAAAVRERRSQTSRVTASETATAAPGERRNIVIPPTPPAPTPPAPPAPEPTPAPTPPAPTGKGRGRAVADNPQA